MHERDSGYHHDEHLYHLHETGPPLDPEVERFLAQRCAERADALADVIWDEIYRKWGRLRYRSLTPTLVASVRSEDGYLVTRLTGYSEQIHGLGWKDDGRTPLNFRYGGPGQVAAARERAGVAAPAMVGVQLYTDAASLPAVRRLVESGQVPDDYGYTSYYFDHDGRSAKTISMPVQVPDSRTPEGQDEASKWFMLDLTAGDWELVDATLGFFESELRTLSTPHPQP
jgi:hypothetical protein